MNLSTLPAPAASTVSAAATTTAQHDAADTLLVDGICALEDYVIEHERACEKLKQGFFKLTMARQHLPTHALSDLSYHEHFDATTVVTSTADRTSTNDADTTNVHWRLALPANDHALPQTVADTNATGLTQRKRTTTESLAPAQKPQEWTTQQQLERQSASILWFSSLPPSDLRHAQKHFRAALQALLATASSAATVQHAVSVAQEQQQP